MNRRVVLVVIAVVLALAGTGVVYAYVKHADNRALADTRASNVLIVQKQIPAGTPWSEVAKGLYTKQERLPTTAAPVDAISNVQAAIPSDEVSTTLIQPGQVLVRPMFAEETTVTGALPIPKGMIAVSVSLGSNTEVAGYVQPQSLVAIFTTFKVTGKAAKQAADRDGVGDGGLLMTKLLLTKVRVIATSAAAPSDVSPRSGSNSSSTSVLITLALSQQDAQKVILAQKIGELYLGLLSDTSNTDLNDKGITNIGQVAPAPIFVK